MNAFSNDDELPSLDVASTSRRDARHSQRLARFRSTSDTPLRLGPGHLLLWMTMIGIYFAAFRALAADQQSSLSAILLLLVQSGIAGAGWSGIVVTVSRRFTRPKLMIEPGQWLSLILGATLALELILKFKPGQLFATTSSLVAAFTCCLLLVPTLSRKLPTAWNALFCLLVVLASVPLLLSVLHSWFDVQFASLPVMVSWAGQFNQLVSLCLPLLLSVWTVLRGTRYTWLHWTGIVIWSSWMVLLLCFGQPA